MSFYTEDPPPNVEHYVLIPRDLVSPERIAQEATHACHALLGYLTERGLAADWETFRSRVRVRDQPARLPMRSNVVELVVQVDLL